MNDMIAGMLAGVVAIYGGRFILRAMARTIREPGRDRADDYEAGRYSEGCPRCGSDYTLDVGPWTWLCASCGWVEDPDAPGGGYDPEDYVDPEEAPR